MVGPGVVHRKNGQVAGLACGDLSFNAQHAPLEAPQKYLDRFTSIADEKRRTFAAMMTGMDIAIGQVLAKIRDMGQEDNTIYFFIGDNASAVSNPRIPNGARSNSTSFSAGSCGA